MKASLFLTGLVLLSGCTKQPPPAAEPASQQQTAKRNEVALNEDAQRNAGIAVEQVRAEAVHESIAATGQLTVNEDETWSVGVLHNGRIASVAAKVGDFVRKGQVLARMHSHEVHDSRAAYKKAALELARLQAAEAQALRVRDRARRLLAMKAASQQEVEAAEAEHRNATAAVQNARAELDKERVHLVEFLEIPVAAVTGAHDDEDFIPVKAVESGLVIERKVTPGTVVTAGQEAFRVTTPASLWMMANVNEADLSALRIGQSVRVLVRAYPDRSFQGKVLRLGEELDPTTRTLKVRVLVPNQGGMLKPEMYASAEIERAAATRDTLFIADSALQDLNGNRVVFVRNAAGRFEPRPVQTGRTTGGRTEVLNGLKPGEVIVAKGSFVLKSQLLKSAIEEE